MPEHVIVEPGLPVPNKPRYSNSGMHIGQGIVGSLVSDAIGSGQILQTETGQAVFAQRPLDAIWPQGISRAHQIDEVPA